MNFLIIILSIIIVFLLFILYRFLLGEKTPLVNNIYLPNNVPDIPLSTLKITDYSTYTIDFWIFVNKLPNEQQCYGCSSWFTISADGNYYWPQYSANDCNTGNNTIGKYANINGVIFESGNLSLDLYNNGTLTFYNGRIQRYSGGGMHYYRSVMTKNFPIQKWTYVVISIQNNSLVDLFINGKLIQSAKYNTEGDSKNAISKPSGSLSFGNRLDASLTKLYITPKATDTNTAWKNYLKGPGLKTNYNLGVSLTQNDENTANINVL